MNIQLITIGSKMPDWVTQGFNEYQKRLKPEIDLQLHETTLIKRNKNADITRLQQQEAKQISQALKQQPHVVALDSRGAQHTSEQLSVRLNDWKHLRKPIALLIGGPEGFAKETINESHEQWSLAKLTYPHPLVRVIVAEQLYRAQCILNGHPYHK